MRNVLLAIAALCLWTAAVAAVWHKTTFSGAGGEVQIAAIARATAELSPSLSGSCRDDLLGYARGRVSALIAAGYPTSTRFQREADESAERYVARCPSGPFLAVASLSAEAARTVRLGGRAPVYASPSSAERARP
jgi:hypothetical protein